MSEPSFADLGDDIYAGEAETVQRGEGPDTDPTGQLYPELQRAYAFLNERLFEGKLPSVLITLQRRPHTEGYWSAQRFSNRDGTRAGEVAINPCYFAVRSLVVILSTLVHLQAHVWQTYFGKPGRRGYHNREWADKMLALGLHPSSTNRPGGAQTGEHVGHFIVPGGLFEVAAAELIAQDEFALTWYDRFPPSAQNAPTGGPEMPQMPAPGCIGSIEGSTASQGAAASLSRHLKGPNRRGEDAAPARATLRAEPPAATLDNWLTGPALRASQRLQTLQAQPTELYPALGLQVKDTESLRVSRSRNKFSCSGCGASAWGKPSLQLKCMPCDQPLTAVAVQ